jgi:hypothetical protein
MDAKKLGLLQITTALFFAGLLIILPKLGFDNLTNYTFAIWIIFFTMINIKSSNLKK